MKIKLDENLPQRLVAELRALGHDVDTVHIEHLTGRDDTEVWQAAQIAQRFLITQPGLLRLAPLQAGTHAGLMLVRLVQPGRNAVLARVSMLFATESVEQWRGCLVVVTDHKVRVKHPP